jgi:hypothetical protein
MRNSRINCGASAASTCRSRKFNDDDSAMTAMASQRKETQRFETELRIVFKSGGLTPCQPIRRLTLSDSSQQAPAQPGKKPKTQRTLVFFLV